MSDETRSSTTPTDQQDQKEQVNTQQTELGALSPEHQEVVDDHGGPEEYDEDKPLIPPYVEDHF